MFYKEDTECTAVGFDEVPGFSGRPKILKQEAKAYRKDTMEREGRLVTLSKDWSSVSLTFTKDDPNHASRTHLTPDLLATIVFKGQSGLKNSDGTYIPDEDGFSKPDKETISEKSYHELDEVKIGGRKVQFIQPGEPGYPVIPLDRRYKLKKSLQPLPVFKDDTTAKTVTNAANRKDILQRPLKNAKRRKKKYDLLLAWWKMRF